MAKFKTATPLESFFSSTPQSGNGNGVEVRTSFDRAIIQVFAAKGKTGSVERALKIKQKPGMASETSDYTAIPLAPGQWMLISKRASDISFGEKIQTKLKKNGYVSEQSDGRMIFSVSGNRVSDLMAKGCRLDLHPSKTGKGWCAQTQIAQAGVILLQTSEKPSYDILVYSGFAQHFAEWLAHTGAQLGIAFKS